MLRDAGDWTPPSVEVKARRHRQLWHSLAPVRLAQQVLRGGGATRIVALLDLKLVGISLLVPDAAAIAWSTARQRPQGSWRTALSRRPTSTAR
jgi:hypothetical protein